MASTTAAETNQRIYATLGDPFDNLLKAIAEFCPQN